ncbi:MAG: AI-2E family transporter [Paludibacteraceae bacterium]|nr:AI-2E family transporter [Paludibacteraceae bacterium]
MQDRPFDLDRTVRMCITIAVLVGLYLITSRLSGVLLPFVVSWFIAYLLHPIVNFFQHKVRLKHRALAVFVTLAVLALVLAGVIAMLVPLVGREVTKMSSLLSAYLSGLNAETLLPAAWQEAIRNWIAEADLQALIGQVNFSAIWDKISPYLSGLLGGSLSFVSGLFVVFICFLYLVFILIDYESISSGLRSIVPPKYREMVYGILADLEAGMNKYFRGQALVATCVGVLFSIGFLITGLPLAVVVGLFIGLLNMVPYLQAFGIPVTMVLGILQSADTGTAYWIILIEIAAVFIVVQAIQDLVLTPLIMGNVIGMNPAVMLLSLSIWGSLLGVAGMIIALPITTVIISYYKRYVLGEIPEPAVTEQGEGVGRLSLLKKHKKKVR